MQHYGAVFSDAIQHDGLFRFGHNLAHDVDRLSLKALKMGQRFRHSLVTSCRRYCQNWTQRANKTFLLPQSSLFQDIFGKSQELFLCADFDVPIVRNKNQRQRPLRLPFPVDRRA
jgi:hypothetical protein